MRDGRRVTLNAFNGTKASPSRCDPKEDYWKLAFTNITHQHLSPDHHFVLPHNGR
jgi:hypothetical protein